MPIYKYEKIIKESTKVHILKRYLVDNEMLKDIYKDYNHIFSDYSLFNNKVSVWLSDRNLVMFALEDFKYYYNPYTREYYKKGCLSSKTEPYYESEEDMLFKPVTFNELSTEEKKIHLTQEYESIL